MYARLREEYGTTAHRASRTWQQSADQEEGGSGRDGRNSKKKKAGRHTAARRKIKKTPAAQAEKEDSRVGKVEISGSTNLGRRDRTV